MTDDPRDPPIIEQDFLCGVTVVDLGDYRVSRGFTRRAYTGCNHHRLVYDNKERRVWCKDCERDVEPFDAFEILVNNFAAKDAKIKSREKELQEIETFKIRTIAAKTLDKAWRKKNTIPCCPHCNSAIFPEDFIKGITFMGKQYAKKLREKSK